MSDGLADWLARPGREHLHTHPNVRPRDASTLILIDRAAGAPRVLLGRRHDRHAFMPGKFVFPGGRVDPSDYRTAVATPLDRAVEERLMARVPRASPARARALAVAAVRELAEETGLVLGRKGGVATEGADDAFAAAGVVPDPAALFFIARAITPPRRARRYDTRFFAADAEAIAHRVEGLVSADSELVELVWLPLAEAKTLDVPSITKAVLTELGQRIAQGLAHELPVPFFRMHNRRQVRELI